MMKAAVQSIKETESIAYGCYGVFGHKPLDKCMDNRNSNKYMYGSPWEYSVLTNQCREPIIIIVFHGFKFSGHQSFEIYKFIQRNEIGNQLTSNNEN